jgi:hypothetical protein
MPGCPASIGTGRRTPVLRLGVTIKIGVILPTSTPDPARPILGDVRAGARMAEEAGLDSVWSTDHLVASAPILDSTVVLATAAAVTDRITIGFGVMLLALRPVAWAAKQIGRQAERVQPFAGGAAARLAVPGPPVDRAADDRGNEHPGSFGIIARNNLGQRAVGSSVGP